MNAHDPAGARSPTWITSAAGDLNAEATNQGRDAAPLWVRVVDTFISPGRLFERFGDRSPWLGALAISTLAAMLAAATQPGEVFLEQMEDPVSRMGKPVEITSPPGEIIRFGRYLAAFSAAVGHPIIALAVAGIVTLLFTTIGGGRVGFVRYLAVTSHVFLIPAAGVILILAARWLFDAPIGSDLGTLMATGDGSTAGEMLRGIDIFHLWMLAVLAIGVERLDRTRSRWSAAAILLGLYLGANLLTVVLFAA